MRQKLGPAAVLALMIMAIASVTALGQQAKSKDTLHTQAKKAGGHFVLKYRPNLSTVYPTVEELAKRSDLIVVGRTVGHQSTLRPDGNFITRDYSVRVQEVIKGDLPNKSAIVVSLAGGSHRFPDGTFVTVMPVGEKQIEDGQLCVFFLKAKKPNSPFKGYLLTSETQGAFALINGQVEPSDSYSKHPVVAKYRGMQGGEFLRNIHKAVPRTKK